MKELPILFSTNMVKAILDGRKTVTRRVIKEVPNFYHLTWNEGPKKGQPRHIMDWPLSGISKREGVYRLEVQTDVDDNSSTKLKPRYQVGDLLYVRERIDNGLQACNFYYHADKKGVGTEIYKRLCDYGWTLKKVIPNIHMPKWAARLWLEVLDVRAERLQEITVKDAESEGLSSCVVDPYPRGCFLGAKGNYAKNYSDEIDMFMDLWDSLNAKRGYPWESNPWVWRYEFKLRDI